MLTLLQTPPQQGTMVLRGDQRGFALCKASKPVPLVGWGPAGASQVGYRGTKHADPQLGGQPGHLKPLLYVSLNGPDQVVAGTNMGAANTRLAPPCCPWQNNKNQPKPTEL